MPLSEVPASAMNTFRAGMQVHAVPDDERAIDASGQPLPWGYAYADSNLNRKQPMEKGPFGRATNRRSMSRSKTATPATKEDLTKLENDRAVDDIFATFKKKLEEKETKTPNTSSRELKGPIGGNRMPHAQSAMDITQSMSSAPPAPGASTYKEPSEVLIYGYNTDHQYAAIEFYESTSGGRIYEDYDRYPPNPRFNTFLTTTARSAIPRSLPQSALRKINTYSGGDHWIKVTFDSPEAAERACYYSPHIIHGYACYAEPWRGVGPSSDIAINSSAANGGSGADSLRQRRTSNQQRDSGSNQRKGTNSMPSRTHSAPSLTGPNNASSSGNDAQSLQPVFEEDEQISQRNQDGQQMTTPPPRPLRIQGATRAVLLPASDALLPVAPWSQRTFGHLPLVGSLVGGVPSLANTKVGELTIHAGLQGLGNVVPRKEDGSFDWERAGWYWRVCWMLDRLTGLDLCGLKGEE